MSSFSKIAMDLIGWLYMVPILAGALVCASRLHQSKWVAALASGFLLQLVVALGYRILSLSLVGIGYDRLGPVYVVMGIVGLMAQTAVVVGVAGLLFERQPTRSA